jgi:Holliday junction DNA helicase RuvA
MIGQLRGIILSKQPPELVLDVQGVGYEISAPMTSFYQFPEVGAEITLLTHLVVREDAQLLYGFHDLKTRSLFRTLIKVSGVGPKLALTLLSGIEVDDFIKFVHQDNAAALVSIPGIGKKTAERLIIETRDALKNLSQNASDATSPQFKTAEPLVDDAISALIALGYKPNEAKLVVARVAKGHDSSEAIIRQALQQLAQA